MCVCVCVCDLPFLSQSGLLVIWRAADSSGQIKSTPLAQYKLGATPTHCVVLAPHDDEEEDEIRLLVAAEGEYHPDGCYYELTMCHVYRMAVSGSRG